MLTVDTMYVGLLVIAILGCVFSLVLDEIKRMLIRWKTDA
jgi:ABC-type nitrate/sulfonate/bicarbonate transport system permease component